MNELDEMLLRRKNLLIVNPRDSNYIQTPTEKSLVVSTLKNVQSLGFTFSKELLEVLFHLRRKEIKNLYSWLIPQLEKLVGADVKYNPMYPNFPQQVMEASEAELFINAIVHYWSFGTLMPEYEKDIRLPLIDDNKMTVLSAGKFADCAEIFNNLMKSCTNLSPQDKEDVKNFIINVPDYEKYLPDEIPLKENVAFISKVIIRETPYPTIRDIKKYFKTATDVLRLVTALSDGDISLATRTKYKSLKRRERRMVMTLLSECGDITEDLFRYKNEWIRIGEIIHPFEYVYPRYKGVNSAFDTLRNKRKPLMFAGKVQKAILNNDTIKASELLKQRPGEFARLLDKLIRDSGEQFYIVQNFAEVAEKVSSPVLLQVRQHFMNRAEKQNSVRVFFPKGELAKAVAIPNELPNIRNNICNQIVDICTQAIISKYRDRESIGKVFIDEDFKNYLVPFSQRSASKATKTIVRGSKLPVSSNAKAIRGFVWWTNSNSRVDIDLSAAIYDENWNYKEHISYTNLRSARYRACHSGDITNGGNVNGNGVAEFLDVDIDAVAKNVGRYIVYQVYSFTGQKFSELPNVRFGWMEREDVNSGEIFEPKTVEMSIDLTANSRTAIPVIFDCVERKFIWCDMNLGISGYRYGGYNLESNLKGVTATCYALTHLNKPNLYDLIYLNACARGEIVTARNQADIIFSNDKTVPYEVVEVVDEVTKLSHREIKDKPNIPIVTSYDTDYYMGQLL